VLRSEVIVLALETPQRPHATSGLAMPFAQGRVGLIVLRERSVFDVQGVLVDGAAHEIVQKGSDDQHPGTPSYPF